MRVPSGPGVRLDAGYLAGMSVPQAFDSLVAKLIVTGATRLEAVQRSRRALAEFAVVGMPTIIPFHRAVLDDPAFVDEPFRVHTRWIETEFVNDIPPFEGVAEADEPAERERITVEVGGRRLEVVVPAGLAATGSTAARRKPAAARAHSGAGHGGSGDPLTAPMQGTIVKVAVNDGDQVETGDLVVVLEAMKMEQPITAHNAGTVRALSAEVGEAVLSGTALCDILD
jgi:acetyl-CoA/propionyl-CoA carboxylase biotin carboxyl carrier protein